MNARERDPALLERMLEYCSQIDEAVTLFGRAFDRFSGNSVYQNAVCLCLLQIGELSGRLSEEFRAAHPEIPWRAVKSFRNIVAHKYASIDEEVVWEIVENDIPALRAFCRTALSTAEPGPVTAEEDR